MTTIKELVDESYGTAREKGWWDGTKATQEQIEALWTEMGIERIPGHDMTNECRLAARILGTVNIPEKLMLMVSELAESLEEHRNGRAPTEVYYPKCPACSGAKAERTPERLHGHEMFKPEGIPIELADVLIRIGDLCGYFKIDLEEAVRLKLAFNLTRPRRHGGKIC